eukprot:2752649-Ditylum_brightwellii.AAC.1
MSEISSPLPTPAADTSTHHLSTNTEKEPHADADKILLPWLMMKISHQQSVSHMKTTHVMAS